jgi:hypothetical protein
LSIRPGIAVTRDRPLQQTRFVTASAAVSNKSITEMLKNKGAVMKRPTILSLTLIAVIVVIAGLNSGARNGIGNEQAAKGPKISDKPGLQEFMHRKLDLSQDVLEGLVTENFEKIQKNAAAMLVLSKAEEWQVSNDMLYRQHSSEFQRVLKQMEKSAKDKSIDGSSLAFVQMTMNCIECHRFVRDKMIADRKQ